MTKRPGISLTTGAIEAALNGHRSDDEALVMTSNTVRHGNHACIRFEKAVNAQSRWASFTPFS